MSSHTTTKLQQNIYSEGRRSRRNLLIAATAGSGKTTTLLNLVKIMSGRSLFLAFNNSIVDELRERTQESADVSTLHSIGFKMIAQHSGRKVDIDNNIMWEASAKLNEKHWKIPQKKWKSYQFLLVRLTELNCLMMCKASDTLLNAAHSIDLEADIEMCRRSQNVRELYTKLCHKNGVIYRTDFTGMVYLPARYPFIKPTSRYENVLVDEAQDLNACQLELLSKFNEKGGRIIAVGDRFQAIYGFAGAMSNSMDILKQTFACKELPLSTSFRCPKAVVKEARKVCTDIHPSLNAAEGFVSKGSVTDANDQDMVLCRNTEPLIDAYFLLISRNKKSHIKGQEGIADALRSIITPHIHKTKADLIVSLNQKLMVFEEKLAASGIEKPMSDRDYRKMHEKFSWVKRLASHYETCRDIIDDLDNIFQDDGEGIILTSIHRAKGLESERVFFLNPELIPSQHAKSPESLLQERNLYFVAVTRSKSKLTYCNI